MASMGRQIITRNYAKFNFRIMQLLGVWNPYDQGILVWLYRFYMTIVFTTIVIVYTLLEIVDAINVKDDLQLFTENICLTLTHLAGIAKIANLWMRKSKIYTIVDVLERELRQEVEGAMGRMQEKMIERATWQGKMVTKTFGALICFTAVAGMAYPFWDQSYKERKFPYRCYFPMDTNQSTYYWTAYTFIGVSVTWQALIILSHDALFVVFMIHVVAQITILRRKVETICDDFGVGINYPRKFEAGIETRDSGSCETSSKFTIVALESRVTNDWSTNLKSCIKYHQGIIRLVSELESMFSNVILLQFAMSLVIIGLTGFQVTVSARSGRFLPMAGYLCCVLLELLLYCWYGNEIIVQSGSLRTSAYVCNWYQGKQKFSKMLKIFMARTQKPLVVTAGNFCDLSLETFATILSRSYSYMAVLNQINE